MAAASSPSMAWSTDSPQQRAAAARVCHSPEKNYRGQHAVPVDPEAHRQPGRTPDIVARFQTGQPEREHSRAEE